MEFLKITSPFLFATSLLFSEEALCPAHENNQMKSMEQCEQMAPGYNASCRVHVERPCDFFISGSFTYWKPVQENMKLGVASDNSDALDLVKGNEVDLHSKYKPGFKVGLGMHFDYDNWESVIGYTWFRGTEHVRKNLHTDSLNICLLPAWEIPNFLDPQYQSGSEKWKLRMDFLDWDVARNYHVGKALCFRPFLGLRGAVMNQRVDVKYINTSATYLAVWPSTFIKQKSDSWGIGPRVGLTSKWQFCNGWRIYGDAEVDVLYTEYDLKSIQTSAVTVANRYIVRQHNANYLRTHVQLDLGLGWGAYFACNKYHIDLFADYGFQTFFDQNMFRSTASAQAVGKSTLPNGNLYIRGLTANLLFEF